MSINQPSSSSSSTPFGQGQHSSVTLNGTSSSSGAVNTPLTPITSESGFEYPAIWSFPPFFTLQPNPSTLSHQLELWRALILRWARHERVFKVNTDSGEAGGVFENKRIKREAAPDPPKQDNKYLIYWKKPDEWGDLIYTWVTDNGLNSSIMTFYEITDGDLSHTTEFYELPPPILRKALESLVKRGKAQLLEGKGEVGEGVRFL
uniref:ESCRT-II complex subunit VPS25 n=1 Tax=Kwoniella bestiolae CBS 10118 TaxID=1296100 RepID=A0A1B9G4D6_9TREE|nr:ESCRT-II complex subunit VPS25 [Kwoniella bestiolae CBS 10118]OCF25895.1 ESCRT-II complex subunit VPS25 [Kwoniella bestiolae CBS 10118]